MGLIDFSLNLDQLKLRRLKYERDVEVRRKIAAEYRKRRSLIPILDSMEIEKNVYRDFLIRFQKEFLPENRIEEFQNAVIVHRMQRAEMFKFLLDEEVEQLLGLSDDQKAKLATIANEYAAKKKAIVKRELGQSFKEQLNTLPRKKQELIESFPGFPPERYLVDKSQSKNFPKQNSKEKK